MSCTVFGEQVRGKNLYSQAVLKKGYSYFEQKRKLQEVALGYLRIS
jgi:hypothetical protein